MTAPQHITLTNCDKEPIHIPGAIQPYAYLIVIDSKNRVCAYSDNVTELLGISHADVMGKNIAEIDQLDFELDLLNTLPNTSDVVINGKPFSLHVTCKESQFICLEFESAHNYLGRSGDEQPRIQNIVQHYVNSADEQSLYDAIAENIRNFTLYDRVMVYRFDKYWNGSVVAESKKEQLESFKGLHYPHTDIPAQARLLYTKKLTRLIENVDYTPSPIITGDDVKTPIDLTYIDSRSISPMHIKYLQNMGVKATLVMSIMVNDKLWGLIACHHYNANKPLNYYERQSCATLAVITSLFIEKLENARVFARQEQALQQLNFSSLCACLENPSNNVETIDNLLQLTGSDGIAIVEGKQFYVQGKTISPSVFDALVLASGKESHSTKIESINALALGCDESELNGCAGAYVLPLSAIKEGQELVYVVLFRKEITTVVNWAGNPTTKEFVTINDVETLSPRRSFALWQQTMDGLCKEWTLEDTKVIELLHNRIKEAYLAVVQKRRDYELKVLAQTSDIGMWSIDFHSGVLNWNESMFNIYGIEPASFNHSYETWKYALSPEDRKEVSNAFEQCVHEKRDFQSTFHITHPSKGIRLIRGYGKCIVSESGDVARVLGTNIDITEEVRNLDPEQVENFKQNEQSRLISLGEMAATVGHEINNPLAIILNSLELQLSALDHNDKIAVADLNSRANKAGERIKKIVAGLRNITRRSLTDNTSVSCYVDEAVGEFVELMNELYANKGTMITCQLCEEHSNVKIDKPILQQVLVNLLTNSVHATQDRTDKNINITGKVVGEQYILCVEDKGVGIAQENMERIFAPFYTDKPMGEGTGLGLPVSRRLVRENGGELTVESQRGTGTTVTIKLALANQQQHHVHTSVQQAATQALAILVIDDEQDLRDVLQMQIQALGHHATMAKTGEEALELLAQHQYDVMLIDSQMTGISGEEVIEKLPKHGDMITVLMTGDVTKSIESLTEAGLKVDELIYKPFGIKQIKMLLDNYGKVRER
ncbi:ATP-binding protein [Pseudoalteromonas sp. SSDWG2]|uniref:ATP-binding protein n=1 Tax=Pseudoalteromonas sp. SSDWG2 TaxID=3139391 RepID=UPI003BA96957